MPASGKPSRAALRSQAGPGSSLPLLTAPTIAECTLKPERFQAMARRRIETGGPFSSGTAEFLRQLAASRAQSVPSYLRASTAAACERRWSRMLAIGASSAHMASLLLDKESLKHETATCGREPWLQDALSEARLSGAAAST